MTDATAALFRSMIDKLWGYGAQTRAARHFEVSDRTVRHWVAGKRAIPERVMAELRAIVSIAPPPNTDASEDRDLAARQALEPALTELRNRALAAGWSEPEIHVAILNLALDEIETMAGPEAAREALVAALGTFDAT